jgi:iron complex transport system ATP-binding protein
MSNELLKLINLSVGYNDLLIENINLNLPLGKLVVLMGKNGEGKSCFLKTISGLHSNKSGNIELHGKLIEDYDQKNLAKEISVLLTDKITAEYLLVEELISMGRAPHTNWNGDFEASDCEEVSKVLTLLNINNLIGKFFSELSDGQKQKVLLARALVQNPKLLILDEPTTFLDIPSRNEFYKILKAIITERKISVVMSSHEIFSLEKIVDEVWLLDQKELKVINNPKDFFASGLFKKIFELNLD